MRLFCDRPHRSSKPNSPEFLSNAPHAFISIAALSLLPALIKLHHVANQNCNFTIEFLVIVSFLCRI